MDYSVIYSDHTDLFPASAELPKEHLIRMCYDPELAGSSSVKTLISRTAACEKIAPTLEEDRRPGCLSVCDARRLLLSAETELKKLRADRTSPLPSHSERLREKEEEVRLLRDDFEKKIAATCGSCPQAASLLQKDREKRLNYARYGGSRETLVNMRVLLGLHVLATTHTGEKYMSSPSEVEGHDISIRVLANLCRLSRNAVRLSLRYWESRKYIIQAYVGRGVYFVAFTREQAAVKYLPASKGGAGYITLPFHMIRIMMSLDSIDDLRLMMITCLNMDHNILNEVPLNLHGESVSTEGGFVRFVIRHRNASLKELFSSFNDHLRDLLASERFRALQAEVSLHAVSDTDQCDRYASVRISMSTLLCPKQKKFTAMIREGNRTVERKDLARGIDEETARVIREALPPVIGKDGLRIYKLFPDLHGRPMTDSRDLLKYTPKTREDTLIPAFIILSEKVGRSYIANAIRKTLTALSSKVAALYDTAKAGSEEFRRIIGELSSYMIAVAKNDRELLFSDWHRLDRTLTPDNTI